MHFVKALLIVTSLALLGGCTTIIDSVNEDPITLDEKQRTWGGWADDKMIATVANVNILKAAPELREARVKVVSFNGIVLLIGQVPNQALKDTAGQTVRPIRKVRKVHNELEIGTPADLVTQSNDSWLTTKVKTSLVKDESINADQILVNTEKSAVYLMGIVTPEVAQKAVEIARNTYGVTKVVTVFEYAQ